MNVRRFLFWMMIGPAICSAQELTDTVVSESYPRLDLHVGAGVVSGVRVGARVRMAEHFSAEVSYGADFRNFIGLSDIDRRYGVGVSWHKDASSNFVVSLLGAFARRPYLTDNYSYFASANLGLLPLSTSGLRTNARFGFFVEFEHKYSGNTNNFGINLDLGLNLVFP